jgi:hypothetical protein
MKNSICSEILLWGAESSLAAAPKARNSEEYCFHHESRRDRDLPGGKAHSERSRNAARLAKFRPRDG